MGRARDLGYLKHDGNVVMIIIEFLKYILFIFMIFTPFVAPAVFCFFVGWMIPREQITQKKNHTSISFLDPCFCFLIFVFCPSDIRPSVLESNLVFHRAVANEELY